jgi:hypothetical protein
MTDTFKYALGAAVILATSLPAAVDTLRIAEEEEKEEARLKSLSDEERAAEAEQGTWLGRAEFASFAVEHGTVVGRSEYVDAPPAYLVSYRDGQGCDREDWFVERRLATWDDAERHYAEAKATEAEAE